MKKNDQSRKTCAFIKRDHISTPPRSLLPSVTLVELLHVLR